MKNAGLASPLEVQVYCGNICYVSTSQLTTGETVSCGCKNDENRANLSNLDRELVDGTMKCRTKAQQEQHVGRQGRPFRQAAGTMGGADHVPTQGPSIEQIQIQEGCH